VLTGSVGRFSELALLLPNTDITLIIFGKAGCDLVQKAKQEHPRSLATKDIVWSYKAPKKCGGGSIKIKIYTAAETWTRDVVSPTKFPDVIIACNAGLLSYDSWGDPMIFSTMYVQSDTAASVKIIIDVVF
jgi:hypothetical protein